MEKMKKNIFVESIGIKYKNGNNNQNDGISSVRNSQQRPNQLYLVNQMEQDKRATKLNVMLSKRQVDMVSLKKFCWLGIPSKPFTLRAECWKHLLNYYPTNGNLKENTIKQRRIDYLDACNVYSPALSNPEKIMTDLEKKSYFQILKDVPRTMPENQIFHNDKMQKMLTRILYIWSMRHQASGYVQGLNDLCTPFFIVYFLSALSDITMNDLLNSKNDFYDNIPDDISFEVETEIFFSLTRMLSLIQTNFTDNQPGITKMMKRLENIIKNIDEDLLKHITGFDIEFVQFSFRWFNCFLMREFSIELIMRLWDTYFSEEKGFSEFHLYVCSSLLLNFSKQIKEADDFQQTIVLLQNLPTENWTTKDIEELLGKAYLMWSLYGNQYKDG